MPLLRALNRSVALARALYGDFREFLAPSSCLCCKQDRELDGALLCRQCIDLLAAKNIGGGPICPFCGRPFGAGTPCDKCSEDRRMDLFHLGLYQEQLQECLLQFKFHGAIQLGEWLARMTLNALGDRISSRSYDFIIAVPLHKGRLRERRFNQSEILASAFAEMLNIPNCKDILNRIKSTQQQAKLEESERWKNVRNAFAISPDSLERLRGRRILLVDDIVTTGATIYEASRPLWGANVAAIDILSVAYAP